MTYALPVNKLDPEIQAHLQKVASPAHLAAYVTRNLPPDAQWRPFKHLLYINDLLVEAFTDPDESFLDIAVSVRHGKQTRTDEPVLTTNGWSTIGELVVGDFVFGPDGKPRKVVGVGDVDSMSPKMRVTFTDGTHVDVHPNHEWTLTVGGRTNTFETRELAQRTLGNEEFGQWRYKLPPRLPLQAPEATLPVPPYTLGVWLGDGKTSNPTLSLGAQDDPEIMVALKGEGVEPSSSWTHPGTGVKYHYLPILHGLRGAGVINNKHVPDRYMVASENQRRALLRGLVDTDGHVERGSGRVRYVSHDERLARDVCALARTLGHRATVYTEVDEREPHPITFRDGSAHNIPTAGTRYVASWTPHDGLAQGTLERKTVIRERKPDSVAIRSITDAPAADGRCIQVAHPDGLYLVGRDLIPTHNSFLISIFAAVWYLGLYPDRQVVIVSYSEDKAKEWGEATMNIMKEFGLELFGLTVDSANASKTSWSLKGRKGGLRAVGIGGALTGRAIDLGIIDDPVKNAEEANSEAARQAMWDWYTTTFRTRLMPGGTVILTMARWHEDDLTGKIKENLSDEGDPWRFVEMPAIAEQPKPPDGEEPDPDWRDEMGRAEGEALWPEVWPVGRLTRIKNSVGGENSATWLALYQQNPTPPEGGMFKTANWRYVSHVDRGQLHLARFWDLAATKGGGDWSVGVLMGLRPSSQAAIVGEVYVIEVVRVQEDDAGLKKLLLATARNDGKHVPIKIEQERAGAGKSQVADYKRMLLGWVVDGRKPEGSKESRAAPFASQQQVGNVYLVEGAWNQKYVEEFRAFPKSKHDDQVDASSGAFEMISESGPVTGVNLDEIAEVGLDRMLALAMGRR